MPLQWTPALAVGIDEIDLQHQELFRRAARLVDGLRGGPPDEVPALLEFLHAYVVMHFGLEEAWMRDTEYPGYVRHKAEHDRFVEDLLEFATEREAQGPAPGEQARLGHWLGEWLVRHVSGTDRDLGRYVARSTA
jgi:hemerythrin